MFQHGSGVPGFRPKPREMIMKGDGAGAASKAFAHIESWIFDLDDTLYPEAIGLHRQMRDRVVLFLADLMNTDMVTASLVHRYYYRRYGATLQALVQRHKVDPTLFLEFVHDVDLSCLSPDKDLAEALAALPGRRIVFTNGSARHAKAVLTALGIEFLFEGVCHIENRGFIGKPQRRAYELLFEQYALDPHTSAIFDDREDNLLIPHELGMRTILVTPMEAGSAPTSTPEHAGEVTTNLTGFLKRLSVQNRETENKTRAG